VSSWTAKDLCRIVEERYKVGYSENGMLKLLKSLDLSRAKTRPAHPKPDRKAQADFKKKFRDLITETAAAHPESADCHSGRIEVWLQDEARVGQTGRNCRRWYQKGTRPTGSRTRGTPRSTSSAPSVRSATPPSAWCCPSSGPTSCRPSSTSSVPR